MVDQFYQMGCVHSGFGGDGDGRGGSCIDAQDVTLATRRGGQGVATTDELKKGSSWEKMAWGTSVMLSRASAARRRRWQRQRKGGEDENKSWLLAEARADVSAEAESAHSSFRLSFGSQTEAEEVMEKAATPAATPVLLLVNLEDEKEGSGRGNAHALKLRERQRLEALERTISSATGNLLRFSYSEIWSAARGFSKGINLRLPAIFPHGEA